MKRYMLGAAWGRVTTILAIAPLLATVDCDGDGYDDETGDPVSITATMSWEGANSIVYLEDGAFIFIDDVADAGSIDVSLGPEDDAYIKVIGSGKVRCEVSVKGETDSESGTEELKCFVARFDIHN